MVTLHCVERSWPMVSMHCTLSQHPLSEGHNHQHSGIHSWGTLPYGHKSGPGCCHLWVQFRACTHTSRHSSQPWCPDTKYFKFHAASFPSVYTNFYLPGVSEIEDVPFSELMYLVFTCMLGYSDHSDSGLCCCIPCYIYV